jgi:mono/diheme cytochrome c family protein|tara:strand:+ start:549 stop:986 length:438 start_codon:yes stop_codon:yes gene_type:complete
MKTSNLSVLRVIFCFAAIALATNVSSGQENTAIWEGVYTAEQAARGEAVYTATCIACHGQDLGGNSNSPGLVGMGFMFLWEGRTLGVFYEKIQAEMPTDRPGQLPAKDYLNVVAYILHKNAFPEGDEELPSSVEALDSITIVSKP